MFRLLLSMNKSDPMIFLLIATMVKVLILLFITTFLYLVICWLKKWLSNRLTARTGYYSWYLLLLAIPLSKLDFFTVLMEEFYLKYSQLMNRSFLWMVCYGLALLWVIISFYRVLFFVINYMRLEVAIGIMNPIDIGELKVEMANTLRLKAKKITIYEAEWISSPITFGFFKKIIFLPCNYQSSYSEKELIYLLLHEMAHIKNHDLTKLYLIHLINCFFLIPPGFIKKFIQDTEIFCDNRVLSVLNATPDIIDDYSILILKVCTSKSTPIKGFAFSENFQSLQNRLHAFEHFKPVKHRLSIALVIIPFSAAIFFLSYVKPSVWFWEYYPQNPYIFIGILERHENQWLSVCRLSDNVDGVWQGESDDSILNQLAVIPDFHDFDGTYEVLSDGNIYVDRYALREVLRRYQLDEQQDLNIYIGVDYQDILGNLRGESSQEVTLFEPVHEVEASRYETIEYNKDLIYYITKFAAHWL